jgi:phage shock protein C
VFAIFAWILTMVNVPVQSGFLSNITSFLMANIGIFFLILLYFSYTSYFSKSEPALYWPVSPIFTALGVVIGFWVASEAIKIVNIPLGISWLWTIAFEIGRNLFLIFWLAMLLGYLVLLLRSTEERGAEAPAGRAAKAVVKAVEQKRLYRSGREKILGGVCGGISEYLGIDPVIVRILFVLAALAWGFGIVLYIILWIIMPRNPRHRWS